MRLCSNYNEYAYVNSFGSHVISGMATELVDMGFEKIDRLTLLDPGCKVPKFRVNGKKQYGLIHKVTKGIQNDIENSF